VRIWEEIISASIVGRKVSWILAVAVAVAAAATSLPNGRTAVFSMCRIVVLLYKGHAETKFDRTKSVCNGINSKHRLGLVQLWCLVARIIFNPENTGELPEKQKDGSTP
jgi:hypothetical protein